MSRKLGNTSEANLFHQNLNQGEVSASSSENDIKHLWSGSFTNKILVMYIHIFNNNKAFSLNFF